MLGSYFNNFDNNNKDILIGKYVGERTLELLEYIYTPEINKLIKNNYQIIATGHSLGGAIAEAFIYFSLIENKITKKNSPIALTFSQPRVGNKLFKEFLDKNSINIRFIRGKDIVPKIPFCNFGLIDMIKYIFNRRNIYNEYVHTKISYYIFDENDDYSFLGISNSSVIEVIILIIFSLLFTLYVWNIYHFIDEELGDPLRLIIFNPSYGYRRIIDGEKAILNLINVIRSIGMLSLACLLFYIIPLCYKYNAYKFFIVLVLVTVLVLILLFYIAICFLLFLYEIVIFVINAIRTVLNLFIKSKTTYKLKEEKFKSASILDKFSILIACCATSEAALGSSVIDKRILSHSKNGQRSGKEKIVLGEEEINDLANKTGLMTDSKELLLKMVDKYEKKKLNMSV